MASDISLCAVCQNDILPDASVSTLNCHHKFHETCLQPWLEHHNCCPLDRGRITSINGEAVDRPEERETIANPLQEARTLYERSIRVIHNPSILSADPVERQAARINSVAMGILGRLG